MIVQITFFFSDGSSGRETMDATLFSISASSRASPVEVGLEVTEETSPCESLKSTADSIMFDVTSSNGTSARQQEAKREGNVSLINTLKIQNTMRIQTLEIQTHLNLVGI